MDAALIVSATLMGLAGAPHCTAMCGAACAGLARGPGASAWLPFHAGRLLGYSAAGAVAASSVGAIAALGQWSPALRPLWTVLHLAALGFGLWLVWQGRQPAWVERLGRGRAVAVADGWQPVRGPLTRGGAGLAWVAWPCGLLQSALLTASLTNSAWAGGAAMAGFALSSSLGLVAAPLVWRWAGRAGQSQAGISTWMVRFAGAALVAASLWALAHDLIMRVVAWCVS